MVSESKLYSMKAKLLDNRKSYDFKGLRGKVVLIQNTATL